MDRLHAFPLINTKEGDNLGKLGYALIYGIRGRHSL